MKKLIFILFGIISTLSVAQNDKAYVASLVSDFTMNLKNEAVNDYFYMYKFCEGHIEMFTIENGRICTSKGTYYEVYVFWKEGDKAMVKKIDNCGLFNSLSLDDGDVLDFAKNNNKQLKKEEVKKYAVKNPENVPIQRTEIHSCKRKFQFNLDNNSFEKDFNLYDLTNESKYENLHYESNNSLKIVELEKKIDVIVSKIASKFRRE